MNRGFWGNIELPVIGLSPMDGVTDAAMRFVTAKYGHPGVIFTEFVSAEAMCRLGSKKTKSLEKLVEKDLRFDQTERPIVAQLFGKDPQSFLVAAMKIVELGFDGVDINMGCPAKKVADRGAGAGLIKNHILAREIIEATKQGAGGKIPVSVKTRIGYEKAEVESWIDFLAKQDLATISIHGRTYRQQYQGLADWSEIGRAVEIIRGISEKTIVLGNGDVKSTQDAKAKMEEFGIDGVLIGRAALGSPWLFTGEDVSLENKLKVAVEHAKKFEELFGENNFFAMRKHLAWYAKGFARASDLRQQLVLCSSAVEAKKIVDKFLLSARIGAGLG